MAGPQHDKQNKLQIVNGKNNDRWGWRLLDPSRDNIAHDFGMATLDAAIHAAHQANPTIDRVEVLFDVLDDGSVSLPPLS